MNGTCIHENLIQYSSFLLWFLKELKLKAFWSSLQVDEHTDVWEAI